MSSSTMQAISKPGAGASLVDILNYQDALIRAGQYEFLGRMKVLLVEASQGASVPGVVETSKVGVRFDWRNEPGADGTGYVENFIPIAQSLDRQMLLCLGASGATGRHSRLAGYSRSLLGARDAHARTDRAGNGEGSQARLDRERYRAKIHAR